MEVPSCIMARTMPLRNSKDSNGMNGVFTKPVWYTMNTLCM